MSCAQSPVSGTLTVATRGSTTPVVFALPTTVENDRFTGFFSRFEVLGRTSNLEVEAFLQFSNDGVTWVDATSGSGWVSSTGWTYLDLLAADTEYRLMRPCIRARTASGQSTVDAGVVRLHLSFRT